MGKLWIPLPRRSCLTRPVGRPMTSLVSSSWRYPSNERKRACTLEKGFQAPKVINWIQFLSDAWWIYFEEGDFTPKISHGTGEKINWGRLRGVRQPRSRSASTLPQLGSTMITQPGQDWFELFFADTIQDPKSNDGSLLVSGRCPSPIMDDRHRYAPQSPHWRDLPDNIVYVLWARARWKRPVDKLQYRYPDMGGRVDTRRH